jgi:hypothetical protein
MNDRHGCDDFQARLDELIAGAAAPDLARRLLEHAATCADCRAVLALERRLAAAASAEALEAAVPDNLVADLWARLAPALAPRRAPARERRWFGRRAAPLWAASTVVLLACSGLLAAELLRLGSRLRAAEAARTWQPPPAAAAAAPWHDLARTMLAQSWGDLTVGEARQWLSRAPRETPLLDAATARGWLETLRRRDASAVRAWPRGTRLDDGLQAGEAGDLLDALRLPPETPLRRLLPAAATAAHDRA